MTTARGGVLVRTAAPFLLALLAPIPAFLIRAGLLDLDAELATLAFGIGIVGAAFCMSWGAEAAERDVPRALALISVALLAVFPEYAVDVIFAWKAGGDPVFAPYAAANMTGSNRLLLGLGWPAVVVLTWLTRRGRVVRLDHDDATAIAFLWVATLYSFSLPLRASISLVDSAILLALFAGYAVAAARSGAEEPDLVGPAAIIGHLSTGRRRLAILALFAVAGATVGVSAEPFAAGLVQTGRRLGIDQFLLVQWLAPLASEAPEFLVAGMLATRGKAAAALGLLLSAKVNQWTLLVGSLPIAFSFGAGRVAALPLDQRQVAEVLLTAAQSFFGLGVLASLSLSTGESALLAGLFLAQLAASGVLRAALHNAGAGEGELFVAAGVYVALGLLFLWQARSTLKALLAQLRRLRQRPTRPGALRARAAAVAGGAPLSAAAPVTARSTPPPAWPAAARRRAPARPRSS